MKIVMKVKWSNLYKACGRCLINKWPNKCSFYDWPITLFYVRPLKNIILRLFYFHHCPFKSIIWYVLLSHFCVKVERDSSNQHSLSTQSVLSQWNRTERAFKSQILALRLLFQTRSIFHLFFAFRGWVTNTQKSFTKCSFGHLLLQENSFSHKKFKQHRNHESESFSFPNFIPFTSPLLTISFIANEALQKWF